MVTVSDTQALKNNVMELLLKYFHVHGDISINDDLSVDVTGPVQAKLRSFPDNQLPVKFGILGGLMVDNTGITSWTNAPRFVKGHVWANSNPLTDLDQAPVEVTGYFGIFKTQIRDLHNLPKNINVLAIDYDAQLPLLPALQAQHIDFPSGVSKAPEQVEEIMTKYAGKGKPGMIRAAVELTRAGYKDNARW